MKTKRVLEMTDAQQIVRACILHAQEHGWDVTVAVVDQAGVLIALQRMDNATPASVEIAPGKAATAAKLRRSTAQEQALSAQRAGVQKFAGYTPIRGGVPIIIQGECLGAVGVSGVKSEQDEQIAQVGVAIICPLQPEGCQ